uniref:Uncharacterized protein n=1 Tax=Plectus sambesii TaxID=2011161 RepID=A0A914UNM4_9BILA
MILREMPAGKALKAVGRIGRSPVPGPRQRDRQSHHHSQPRLLGVVLDERVELFVVRRHKGRMAGDWPTALSPGAWLESVGHPPKEALNRASKRPVRNGR